MKPICLLLILMCLTTSLFAQKNVIPVSKTSAIGLQLPYDSKQDKRLLSVSAARMLLEMETKKAGTGVSSVEVYTLPPVAESNYNSNSLVQALSDAGYEIAGVEGDDKFAWAIRDDREAYMLYFSMDKNETNLYIGVCAVMPAKFQQQNVQYTDPGYQEIQQQELSAQTTIPDQIPAQDYPASQTTLSSGFQFSVSNFDDGWVASVQNDWVLVEKRNARVFLYYAVSYNSDNFSGTGVMDRDYYWDNYVAKQFKITTKQYHDAGEFISSLKPKYVEGQGTDPITGRPAFIAMTLSVSPNAAQITVASYPDEHSFRQQFPKANDKYVSDLTNMSRYNKFAIGINDLIGTWQSGGSQMTQWYNAITGAYSGATFASSAATFNFHNGGIYSSIHSGATGAVGYMNTFQQEYKGNYSVSNWLISATNRYEGKTGNFDAHFQAVKGGRLLYLNDNAGSSYLLVKIK
jgi:hypothetical protein